MDEYNQEPEWALGQINLNQVFSARERDGIIQIEGNDGFAISPDQSELARARIHELNTWRPRPSDEYGEGFCDERDPNPDALRMRLIAAGGAYR